MRARRAATIICATVGLLAGCATTVTGSGQGSAGPAPGTPTPAPTGPTAFPSTSGSPSSAPATSALDRTKVDTALGDAVTADLCTVQGLSFLKPLGYPTEFAPERFPAGCTFRAVRHGSTQVGVTEYASPPDDAPARSGGRYTTVNGSRVYVLPKDSGSGECIRDVHARGAVIAVTGYAIETPRTSPKICGAADLAVQRLTGLLSSGVHFPSVPLAAETVYDLDLCKVASAARLDKIAPLSNSTVETNQYGAECALSNKTVYAYLDVARFVPADGLTSGNKVTAVGGHTLWGDAENTSTNCDFISRQGSTADGVEVIDFLVNARSIGNPPANLCARSAKAFAKVLDAAGLP